MKKQSIIAIVVLGLALAGGGRALADMLDLMNYSIGLETYGGGPNSALADDYVGTCALAPGVTRAQVQADFAAGNVSQIINYDTKPYVYGTTGDSSLESIGWYPGFFSVYDVYPGNGPGVNYWGTATPDGMTAAQNLAWFRLPQHLYCMALNAPSVSAFLAMPASEQQMGLWTSDQTEYGSQTYDGYTYNGDPWVSQLSNTDGVTSPALEDAVSPQGVTVIGGQPTGQYESPPSDLSIQSWVGGPPWGALWLAPVPVPTPEPSTLLLLATALFGLLTYAWRKRR